MSETWAEIAVIGGGPAGLMAAQVAASAGAGVLLVERSGWTGGRLGLQVRPLQGPRSIYRDLNGVEYCRRLLAEVTSAGVEAAFNTPVTVLERPDALTFVLGLADGDGERSTVRASAAVLATGSSEPRPRFPGSNLRGVMLSGDAQEMLNRGGTLPGRRVLMVGSDNAGLLIAADLIDADAEVVAVVDESPEVVGREVNVAPLREAGVEILTSSRVVTARGTQRVESAAVGRLDSNGTLVDDTMRSLDVDTVCLALPRTPESSLAAQAGCPLQDLEVLGGPVPVHDRGMATSVPGLYVCGDASGTENGAVSLESGRMAGLSAARQLGYVHPRADAQESLARGRLAYLRRGRRGLLRRRAKATLEAWFRAAKG